MSGNQTKGRAVQRKSTAAFTLVETLVAIGIVGVLVAFLLPAVSKVRAAHHSSSCVSNLRQIVTAFHLYAQDNNMKLPDPSKSDLSWEQLLTKYTRGNFACPADNELAPVVGSSYDWRDTGDKMTSMAGRSITDYGRPSAIVVFEALPGWHGRGKINVARLDNSVATVDEADCYADLRAPLTGPGPVPTH